MNAHERRYLAMLMRRPKYAGAIAAEWSVAPRFVIARADGTVEQISHSAEVEEFCNDLQREWRGR